MKNTKQNQTDTTRDKICPNKKPRTALGVSRVRDSVSAAENSNRKSGSRSSKKSEAEGFGGGEAAALGINGSIVRHSANGASIPFPKKDCKNKGKSSFKQEKRRTLWSLQREAVRLLHPEGMHKNIKGIATCRWGMTDANSGVDVVLTKYCDCEDPYGSFVGVQTCGKLWQCPICAGRISERRRKDLNGALAWARAKEYKIGMMTLTARHGEGDALKDLLHRMKEAKRRMHRHRGWTSLKGDLIACVTATEVTHGKNGWHPHFHMIVIYKSDTTTEAFREFAPRWHASLKAMGLDGNHAAYQFQNADKAGEYVSKWGAAEELTLSGKKLAKKGGKSPLQLLEASKAGSEEAGELWLEYDEAFFRRTQLDGLSKLLKLAEMDFVSDEEAAENEGQEDEVERELVVNLSSTEWRKKARKRRTDVLDAAEDGGARAVQAVLDRDDESLEPVLIEDESAPVSREYDDPEPSGAKLLKDLDMALAEVLEAGDYVPPEVQVLLPDGLRGSFCKGLRPAQEPSRTAFSTSAEGEGGQGSQSRAGAIQDGASSSVMVPEKPRRGSRSERNSRPVRRNQEALVVDASGGGFIQTTGDLRIVLTPEEMAEFLKPAEG